MGIFRWKDLDHLRRLINAWPHGETMAETRRKSDPTIPIPATQVRAVLEAEGDAPTPDDDTPTQPDIRVPCSACFDSRKVAVKTDAGTRFDACPDCTKPEDAP